ncbi:MAG: hypothetical protein PUC99_02910 [Eubacteriales bacterium]|nr:hypothetical protein [Eubacteriales bacterium]
MIEREHYLRFSSELKNGLLRGYADASIEANLALRPQFIFNDPAAGRKVLVDLENELRRCDRFAMSVAFVTMGGITPLLQTLKDLKRAGKLMVMSMGMVVLIEVLHVFLGGAMESVAARLTA